MPVTMKKKMLKTEEQKAVNLFQWTGFWFPMGNIQFIRRNEKGTLMILGVGPDIFVERVLF